MIICIGSAFTATYKYNTVYTDLLYKYKDTYLTFYKLLCFRNYPKLNRYLQKRSKVPNHKKVFTSQQKKTLAGTIIKHISVNTVYCIMEIKTYLLEKKSTQKPQVKIIQ